jgi:5'-nucleotidase
MAATKALLADPRVQVGDPPGLEGKLAKLVEGGHARLQLIVDFDYTMSRAHRDNVPVDCSWGVLENYPELPGSYTEKVKVLRDKYYPIEIDPTRSVEDKTPHMAEVMVLLTCR